MSRETAIAGINSYFDSGAFQEELAARIAIPTESQKEDSLENLQRYLDDAIKPSFEEMGFSNKYSQILFPTKAQYYWHSS